MFLCAELCIPLRCIRAGVFACLLACVFVCASVSYRLSLSLVGTSVIRLRDCVSVTIGTHVNTHVCLRSGICVHLLFLLFLFCARYLCVSVCVCVSVCACVSYYKKSEALNGVCQ